MTGNRSMLLGLSFSFMLLDEAKWKSCISHKIFAFKFHRKLIQENLDGGRGRAKAWTFVTGDQILQRDPSASCRYELIFELHVAGIEICEYPSGSYYFAYPSQPLVYHCFSRGLSGEG
jgi:hypothetical protein